MRRHLISFLRAEAGDVSADAVVLTSLLLATGYAVVAEMRSEEIAAETAAGLRGGIVQAAFAPPACAAIEELQRREVARAIAHGERPVRIAVEIDGLTSDAAARELARLRDAFGPVPQGTREGTLIAAMECAAAAPAR